jgi:ParB family chromosome partitioning protein
MTYKLSKVPVSQINLHDHSFRITTARDKPDLVASVGKIGLLEPPALQAGAAGLSIVSGFRRIDACRQLNFQSIPVRLLAADCAPMDCLRIAVTENASQRPLNLVETARAVQKFKQYCRREGELKEALADHHLPASRAMIGKLERLGRLHPELQAAIVEGWMGLNTALSVGELPRPDQTAVCTLFAHLRLSVSKQKEILAVTQDIAGRDRKFVGEVLQSTNIQAILAAEDLERNQKTALIRRYLKQTRFPNLSRAEERYHETVRALRLGPRMRIDPPPAFEGENYTLSLHFRNRQDLEHAYRKLGALLKDAAIDTLFSE